MFSWLQSFNHNKMVSKHKKFWEPTMETRQEATEDHLRKVEKDISDLGFAYSTLSGKIDSSYKTLKNMCYKQDRMEELMQDMNSKYESIVAMLARLDVIQTEQGNKQIEGYSSGTVVGSGDVGNRNHNNERGYGEERAYTKLPKIEFPIFGGDNPREWVRNANKYFQLHQILDDLKMGIVEMYLTGKAYVWFHGFLSSHSNADWGLLSTEVCRRFDLVAEEEEEEAVEEVLAEEEQISLDALRGSMNHKTIKIPGKVRGKNISILIDSWSIHSVIDDNLVQTLGYQNGNNRSLTVTMANGQRLESGSIYPPLIWQMQGMEYQYKFRSLKLGGSDMVLGIDWLSQFGPITFDFIQGHISFVNEGIEVILTSEFEMITGPQMNSLMVQQAYGIIGQLCALTEQEVMNSYEGDSMAAEKIQSLIIDPTSDQEYKYYNGVLRYKCKSPTMFGCAKQPGIIYRSLRKILGKEKGVGGEKIGVGRFVQVTVSEIYNEKIYDLLPSANIGGRFGLGWSKAGSASKVKLEMMGKKLKNASFISGNEAGKLLKEIKKVEKRRIVKSTLYNERSSRSHCMIILDVPTVGGRFMLVDMAGSENIEQAGQNGMEAKMQTTKINQGNIALKRVVESIANGDSHVPFRDSKLTMLLQDSFEDNKSKILMILCAGPGLKGLHKIIAKYGAKAKCIVCGPYTPIKEKGVEDSSSAVILGSRIEAMDQLIYMMQMERKLKEKERNEAQKELRKKEEEISGLRTKLALVDGRGTGISENEIDSKVNDQTQMLKSELERTENVSLSANIEENSFIKRLLQVGSEDSDQIFKDYHDFKPWGQGLFKSGGCYESEPTAEERTLAAAEEEEEQWTAAELRKKTVATEI